MINELWQHAGESIELAILDLLEIKNSYKSSSLDPAIVVSRMHSLDTKISALKDIKVNNRAFPWSKDYES